MNNEMYRLYLVWMNIVERCEKRFTDKLYSQVIELEDKICALHCTCITDFAVKTIVSTLHAVVGHDLENRNWWLH